MTGSKSRVHYLSSIRFSVTEDQTDIILKPSLTRAFAQVLLLTLLVVVIAAVSEWYRSGLWWSADYCVSLSIPMLLMPTFVCLMFVPRRIVWSSSEFQIQPRFGASQKLPWTQLYAYGRGRGVFLLQFTDVGTFQIYTGAFSRSEWRAFRLFLTSNYPDMKTSFWFGPKAIR